MSPLGRLPNFGALTLLGLVYCSQAGAAPSYQSINRSFSNGPNGSFDGMSVDINRDGIGDVSFKHVPAWGTGLPLFYSEESVIGTNGAVVAQVGAQPQSFAKADAIGPAEFVGPHLNWTAPGTFEAQINGFNGNPEFVNPDTSIGVR